MKTLTVEQIQQVLAEKNPVDAVVAEHTEDGHFYRVKSNNALYPSVTTKAGILDAPHLKKWSAGLAVDYILKKISEGVPVTAKELQEMKPAAILHHQELFRAAGDIGTLCHGVIEEYLKAWIATCVRPADIREFVQKSPGFNDARVWAAARSAEKFCKEFYVIPIATEMKLASIKHKYAGTLDSLMMVAREVNKGNGMCDNQMAFDGTKGKEHEWMDSANNPLKKVCTHCWKKIEYEFSIVDWKSSNSIGTPDQEKFEYAMQQAAYDKALTEMTGLRVKRIYVVRIDKEKAKYEVRMLVNRADCFKAFIHTSRVYDWMNDGKPKLVSAMPKTSLAVESLSGLSSVT